jgi:hypothetical protein
MGNDRGYTHESELLVKELVTRVTMEMRKGDRDYAEVIVM